MWVWLNGAGDLASMAVRVLVEDPPLVKLLPDEDDHIDEVVFGPRYLRST